MYATSISYTVRGVHRIREATDTIMTLYMSSVEYNKVIAADTSNCYALVSLLIYLLSVHV